MACLRPGNQVTWTALLPTEWRTLIDSLEGWERSVRLGASGKDEAYAERLRALHEKLEALREPPAPPPRLCDKEGARPVVLISTACLLRNGQVTSTVLSPGEWQDLIECLEGWEQVSQEPSAQALRLKLEGLFRPSITGGAAPPDQGEDE